MAIPIKKFGQYVHLQVTTEAGDLVFSTDSLKVDFDIRHIEGWSRGKITVTNLNPETIKEISNGDRYVTLKTALHDSELDVLADEMFISNALEEKAVPNSLFNMYCYSKIRKKNLEKQIDIEVASPSIRESVKRVLHEAEFTGGYEFKHFPKEVVDYVPPKKSSKKQGSVIEVLREMGDENRFSVYTVGGKILIMYKPTGENVAQTDLYTGEGDIVLDTNNMRANPKLGPSTMKVFSNLDPRIMPASILDVSKLLTAGTDVSDKDLEVSEDALKSSIAGFTKYQSLFVQHKGSNWTKEWLTTVSASSPSRGTSMNTDKWWQ